MRGRNCRDSLLQCWHPCRPALKRCAREEAHKDETQKFLRTEKASPLVHPPTFPVTTTTPSINLRTTPLYSGNHLHHAEDHTRHRQHHLPRVVYKLDEQQPENPFKLEGKIFSAVNNFLTASTFVKDIRQLIMVSTLLAKHNFSGS